MNSMQFSVIPDPVSGYGAGLGPGSSLLSIFLDSGFRRNDGNPMLT